MNAKLKKRLIVVSGVIVIVVIALLAFVGGQSAATTMSVAQATESAAPGQKIQVSGNVVDDSYSTSGNTLTFEICDPDNAAADYMTVRYSGAASSTFGNGVTAICTGKVANDGTLECTELVTKCPSKYESATDALDVDALLEYGSGICGKVVKVAGSITPGTLQPAGADVRFELDGEGAASGAAGADAGAAATASADAGTAASGADAGTTMPVVFDGALSDEITDGTRVVITGALSESGTFEATDVALEG